MLLIKILFTSLKSAATGTDIPATGTEFATP